MEQSSEEKQALAAWLVYSAAISIQFSSGLVYILAGEDNIAPRVWPPTGQKKTGLRGGAGNFFLEIGDQTISSMGDIFVSD